MMNLSKNLVKALRKWKIKQAQKVRFKSFVKIDPRLFVSRDEVIYSSSLPEGFYLDVKRGKFVSVYNDRRKEERND